MAFYIAVLAHALLPLAVIVALVPALCARESGALPWGSWLALAAGFVGGGLGALVAALNASEISVATSIHAATLAVAALGFLILPILLTGVGKRRGGRHVAHGAAMVLLAAFAARGVYDAVSASANRSLTVTDVVNTEMIVNSAALAVGAALLIALALAGGKVVARAGRLPALAVLALVLAMEVVAGSAAVMLGLLKLDAIGVTSGRISYVAKVLMVAPWAAYGELALLLVLGLIALFRAPRVGSLAAGVTGAPRVEHRKRRATALFERRWRARLAGLAVFLFAALAYQDLYASLPPALSPAAPVTINEQDEVRIAIDDVKDGNLHRYSYIAADGHRVRFFLINRYDAEHVHIGVVFDACMICGDDGYVQRGDEIICIACGVRIFKPSIGKPGGCNPIPLKHEVDGETIVIAKATLDKGASYFSEVVEVDATDPVNGEAVNNLKAPYRYDYGGRTYFFSGEDSYEEFKADPEKYTKGVEARRMRVQGHADGEG